MNPFGLIKKPQRHVKHAMPWQQVAAALVKEQDLHEGIWRVYFVFGQHAMNVDFKGTQTAAVMNAIVEVGLIEDNEVGPMSVDAAVVNPLLTVN